jgi:hypothetical protein
VALEVVGTSSDKIKIFDENGKRAGEIDKSQAVKRRAVDCNEDYGLIKIVLADNRAVWIDRSESQRVTDSPQTVCVTAAPSKDPTSVLLASNGAQSDNCSVKP